MTITKVNEQPEETTRNPSTLTKKVQDDFDNKRCLETPQGGSADSWFQVPMGAVAGTIAGSDFMVGEVAGTS